MDHVVWCYEGCPHVGTWALTMWTTPCGPNFGQDIKNNKLAC